MAYMGRIWGSAIVLVKTLTHRVMIHVKHFSQHLVRNRCSNNVSSSLVPFDHPESLILCSPSQSLLWWSFLWSEVQWVQWVISILFLQKLSSCEVQNTHQLSCCWSDFCKSEHYQRPLLVCLLCTLWSVLWLTEPHWPMRPSPLLDNELAAAPKFLMPFMIYPSHPYSPFSNQWSPSRYYILVCIFHKFIFMQLYYIFLV